LDILKPEDVDQFTETVLEQCLSVLDKIPESVFRIRELLVAVGQRNGKVWMEKTLDILLEQVNDNF